MGRFHRHDDGSWHDHEVNGDGPPAAHAHDTGDHTQYQTGRERVQLLERVFGENDRKAAENRGDLEREGVIAINLMSAPGAGKTTLLRETLRELTDRLRVAVIRHAR